MRTEYIIAASRDRCEFCLASVISWEQSPALRHDAMGEPLTVLKRFWASSWDEAREESARVQERERRSAD